MSDRVEWAEGIEAQLGDEYQPPADTREFFHTIKKVEKDSDGQWTIHCEGGTTFGMNKSDWDDDLKYGTGKVPEPKVGDSIKLFTVQYSKIIGMCLNDQCLFLKSEREVNLDWLVLRARLRRKNIERYEANKDRLSEQLEALPEPLKRRLKRILKESPEFRYESMGFSYELFCMTEAAKFAKVAEDTIAAIGELPSEAESFWANESERRNAYSGDYEGSVYETQPKSDEAAWLVWVWAQGYERQEKILGLDKDHSGNTFGAAMRFAIYLLDTPDQIQ